MLGMQTDLTIPMETFHEYCKMVKADQVEVQDRLASCDHSFGTDTIRGKCICRSCGEIL